MGEWIVGAFINLFGSIAINFGTNLLKLGHNERERHSVIGSDGTSGKLPPKPIIYFQTWRIGIVFFFLGNCLNFISFGYAAQSLLAALGSVQFVSNIAFAYFVLNKTMTVKERRAFACYIRTRSQTSLAHVAAIFLCCSFSSNLLRLAMSSSYQLHGWFTYSMLLLFLSTTGFWMARLNEGLSLFDAILIVPTFQIAWTFFSICTGFIYFQEYQELFLSLVYRVVFVVWVGGL